jgi:hypothetical protein
MFCPECSCEYVGWTGKCPICKTTLIEAKPEGFDQVSQAIAYDDLLSLIEEKGGQLKIDLSTASIEKERKWTFPYFGFGYAWSTKMVGRLDDLLVELITVEVGKNRSRKFPYNGYGFAWEKRILGTVGGNEIALDTTKVSREKKWRFPYMGYGRAWTEEMAGECGDRLKLHLMTTEVGRSGEWRFPYRAYGFAWIRKAVLTFTLGR